jgi:hypothetical protein
VSYIDPASSEWPAVNLIDGLIAKPTTETKSALEDQTTVVLAWLLDRWPALAHRLTTKCFVNDAEALDALAAASRVGARTWLSLPKLPCSPGGGVMRPDLSIAGDARSFELIIENKVDAAPHHYECLNGCHDPPLIPQQDAYALSWGLCPAEHEARVRRVSVLSRDPVERGEVSALRSVDISWLDVRDLIRELLDEASSDGDVGAVASDFLDVLDERVLAQAKPSVAGAKSIDPIEHPVLIWGAEFLAELLPSLATKLDGRHSGPLLNGKSFYAGGYVRFDALGGQELSIWFCVTEAGRPYSVPGFEDGLWIVRDGPWPAAARESLKASGFAKQVDQAGYGNERIFRPAAELQAAAAVVPMLVAELTPSLQQAASCG